LGHSGKEICPWAWFKPKGWWDDEEEEDEEKGNNITVSKAIPLTTTDVFIMLYLPLFNRVCYKQNKIVC
jgi:hypothetical protein